MILEEKEIKEFHENGNLKFIETRAYISKDTEYQYENRRFTADGKIYIRIKSSIKYFDNNQMAWRINYDKLGKAIKNESQQFRKDGTKIIF